MNFSNEVTRDIFSKYNYNEFSSLMFDTATYRPQVDAKVANNKIRDVWFEILGLDSKANRKGIRKAIRRHKVDIFEVTEEVLDNLVSTGWQDNPFFQQFVEYRSANEGDTNMFYTQDNVILTVSKLSGNHHDIIRQKLGGGEAFSVKTSWYGLKVYTEFELFLAGRIDWAGYIQKVYQAFDKKVNSMLYSAVMGATSQVTPSAQFVKSAQLTTSTAPTLIKLCTDVQAANNGADVVIMGTRAALARLPFDTNWISDGMKNERNTTGRVGIWEGWTTAEIPQGFADNDTTTPLVSDDVLLVMPVADNKFIKFYNEGDAMIKEVTDGATNMDATIEFEYQMKLGFAVVLNRKFGKWTILP